ncbi:AAA family ATPase [Pseudomonas aeruginosa]|nr:ATP-binding protein [Pseudomonas aeruginosa]
MNQIAEIPNELSPVEQKRSRKMGDSSIIRTIPKLLEAYAWRQDEKAREICLSLLEATEVAHPIVHKQLTKILRVSTLKPSALLTVPKELVVLEQPQLALKNVVLSPHVEEEISGLIAETLRSEELAAFDLQPRHRVLLHGEPGNGKTMLAEALASELELPFLRAKYSGLVDSYIGGTGKNIDKLFEYAATAPCVLFLDEFDGVAIARDGAGDVTEMRRVTNQLLISLDQLPAHCLFVAATNSQQLVDKAILRRFDLSLELPSPDTDMRSRTASIELCTSRTPGNDVRHLISTVAELKLKNLSDVVNLCRRIRRDLVLNQGRGIDSLIASAR